MPRETSDSWEDQLQKLGLKRDRKIWILAQESDVTQKFRVAYRLWQDFASSSAKRTQIKLDVARMHELKKEIIELDFEIDELKHELDHRSPQSDSQQIARFDDIQNRYEQLRKQRNLDDRDAKRIESDLSVLDDINTLDANIERGRKLCRSALDDLGRIIEATDKKYAELKANVAVQSALAQAGSRKLEPSLIYRRIVAWKVQAEGYLK